MKLTKNSPAPLATALWRKVMSTKNPSVVRKISRNDTRPNHWLSLVWTILHMDTQFWYLKDEKKKSSTLVVSKPYIYIEKNLPVSSKKIINKYKWMYL